MQNASFIESTPNTDLQQERNPHRAKEPPARATTANDGPNVAMMMMMMMIMKKQKGVPHTDGG
jgi:hypothetical protein